MVFSTSPAALQDLDDGSSTVLGLGSMQNESMDCSVDVSNREASEMQDSTKSRVLVPSGEVPDAEEVGYHRVNPMFESCEHPEVIFCSLCKAMEARDIEFSCSPDWTVRDRL